jgi:hypothetical protein
LHDDATRRSVEAQVAILPQPRTANLEIPSRVDPLCDKSASANKRQRDRYLAGMAEKMTPRQQAQLAWLETLPPKFERIKRTLEMLASHKVDDTQVRGLIRLLDELKAQASGVNITPLAENFGYMGMLLRRVGGHQTKVRGLGELLAGARVNFEGAYREASTPAATPEVAEENISP